MRELPQFTPLNISYEKLLLIISNLPNFKWPTLIQTNPSQRNKSLRCSYHRDHGHETNRCRSLKFLVEKLIKVGHLRRYVKVDDHIEESGQATDRVMAGSTIPSESRPAINYILRGPSNDQYQSKHQQKKILRAATVKAMIKAIQKEGSHEETKPIDGFISFPLVNSNRIIVLHYDALVLTLCNDGFDVHRVLVDPSSAADLLQLPVFKHMKLSLGMLNLAG